MNVQTTVLVPSTDLNSLGGVHCPQPTQAAWNSHPKVFIDLAKHGQGRCHYCGTLYRLQLAAGDTLTSGH